MFFIGLAAGFLLAPIKKGISVRVVNDSCRQAQDPEKEPDGKKPEPVPIHRVCKDGQAEPDGAEI